MSERAQVAYHEAGHAIAAIELDVQFDVISIVPGEGRAGSVGIEGDDGFFVPPGTDPFSPENERAFRVWAEQQAVIDYAGHAALVALLGIGDMSYGSGLKSGAKSDFDKASERLGRDRRRIVKAKASAIEIVTRRGKDVRKIATGLVEHKRLDAQRVQNLLHWGTQARDLNNFD